MAINFYGNLSLDTSEIKDLSLERVSALPSSPNQGRIVFKFTSGTAGTLQIYPSTSASQPWLVLDGTGNIDSLNAQNGVVLTSSGEAFTFKADYSSSSNVILSAPDGASVDLSLSGSNFIASQPGSTGTVADYTFLELQTLLGTGVDSIAANNTGAMAIPLTVTNPTAAVEIEGAISATSAGPGTYLKATSATAYEWAAFPTYTNTQYTLPVTTGGSGVSLFGIITLTPSPSGTSSVVNYKGTVNQIELSASGAGSTANLILKLSSTLQIANDITVTTALTGGSLQALTVTGNTALNGSTGAGIGLSNLSNTSADFTLLPVISAVYGDYSAATNQWANVAYVTEVADDFVIYKGGYNANTDNPGLDGVNATQIPVEKGWAYAVTTPGDFFSEEVEIGDLLIAEDNFAAGASVLGDWTVVQNKIGLATNSVAGIAKYSHPGYFTGFKGTFSGGGMTAGEPSLIKYTVTNTGTASATPKITTSSKGMITAIVEEDISITASQINNFGADVQTVYDTNIVSENVGNNSSSTITVNHGLDTLDVFVQVYDNSATNDPNVFAEVVRTDVDNVALTFSSVPTTNQFKVLIRAIY